MGEKVVMILVDGMRADSLEASGHPYIEEMKKIGSYTLTAQTVMPSVTLPCHMSLFHSVPPERHGVTTNTYTPQVRPILGLVEQLNANKKDCAFFYSWGELRDLTHPYSLAHINFISGDKYSYEKANEMLTKQAIEYMNEEQPDFTFLYLGLVDEWGHKYGWMSEKYLESVSSSWDQVEKTIKSIPDDYTVIVLADHGGHDRGHGTDRPEDMTIPVFAKGKAFDAGRQLGNVNIIDIAPTITQIMGVEANKDWEGKCFI